MTEAWQEQHAAMADRDAAELERLLAELDNAEAVALSRGRDKYAAELRAVASATRSEITSARNEARALRAVLADDARASLPVSMTTRRVG